MSFKLLVLHVIAINAAGLQVSHKTYYDKTEVDREIRLKTSLGELQRNSDVVRIVYYFGKLEEKFTLIKSWVDDVPLDVPPLKASVEI